MHLLIAKLSLLIAYHWQSHRKIWAVKDPNKLGALFVMFSHFPDQCIAPKARTMVEIYLFVNLFQAFFQYWGQ